MKIVERASTREKRQRFTVNRSPVSRESISLLVDAAGRAAAAGQKREMRMIDLVRRER
jgi:hypothetical protein